MLHSKKLLLVFSALPALALADVVLPFHYVDQRDQTKVCGHGDPHAKVTPFKTLKDAGQLYLVKHFERKGKCYEGYEANFKGMTEFRKFAKAQPLPNYSFGDISYAIYEATINHAIATGDAETYKNFLTTNIKPSASEEFHELMTTLRQNEGAFLRTYCTALDGHQQDDVKGQQFDFNKSREEHFITGHGGAGESCRKQWNEDIGETYDLFMTDPPKSK